MEVIYKSVSDIVPHGAVSLGKTSDGMFAYG